MNLLENQRAADVPTGTFQDLEELLMSNIIRHCKDYNQPIASDKWLLQKLAEIGKLNQENIRIIAQSTGVSQTAMEQMLMDAAKDALKNVDPGLAHLSKQNLIGEAVEADKSENVKQVMDGMAKRATDTRNLCNTTMLYKARDDYKGFVRGVAAKADEIAGKQDFLDKLNKHATAATIGAESRQQAMRKCIQELNKKGIPVFVDKRGREWTPEAYVNMAMRATAKNAADEVQTARCVDYGINLISIDTHSGSRPRCAKDQGKIFDLNNKSGQTEDLNGKKIPYYPWSSSSYGKADGILGINCTHHKFPFVPGVNIHRYFPTEDMDANNKLYRETQVQRALERNVRKQKRECMLFDQIGDEEAFKDAAVELKQREAKLKSYVDGNNQLHRRKNREQVVGFDKRISSSAVAANKAYTKAQNTDTIKLKDTIIHKSVGAKYKNHKVVDKTTGVEYEFSPGTRIQNSEVFAGKGTKRPLHEGVAEGLSAEFGGVPAKWQHAKGTGVLLDAETGEEYSAEVHWFQEESIGKVKFKVKEWLDEG